MAKSLRAFQAALLIGWVALGAAGGAYARVKGIPLAAAWPIVLALLIEYPFYLVTGFREIRERLAGPLLPIWLLAVAILPYLVCCVAALHFEWTAFIRLAALAMALALWYHILPAHPIADLAFLGLNAAVLVGGYFRPIYPVFYKQHLEIVGHISQFVIAILVLMLERRVPETGYAFLPNRHHWRIGAVNYLWFVATGLPLALVLKGTHFIQPRPIWVVVGTFFAFLWFTSLTEEFFFRGVLQRWFEDWTASGLAALIVTSLIFGGIHYWFRGWAWVPIGAILGFFCGRARIQAGSILAGVVTHTLVVTTWRAFFW